MMSRIGCQPFWLDHIQTDLQKCTNIFQIRQFLFNFTHLASISSEKKFTEEYNCLKPCKYMQYKVGTVIYLQTRLKAPLWVRVQLIFNKNNWMLSDELASRVKAYRIAELHR